MHTAVANTLSVFLIPFGPRSVQEKKPQHFSTWENRICVSRVALLAFSFCVFLAARPWPTQQNVFTSYGWFLGLPTGSGTSVHRETSPSDETSATSWGNSTKAFNVNQVRCLEFKHLQRYSETEVLRLTAWIWLQVVSLISHFYQSRKMNSNRLNSERASPDLLTILLLVLPTLAICMTAFRHVPLLVKASLKRIWCCPSSVSCYASAKQI